MKRVVSLAAVLGAAFLLAACGNIDRTSVDPSRAAQIESATRLHTHTLTRAKEDQILALNPRHVTERDLRGALAGTPAPRLILIHGGIASVIPRMVSFSEFLTGMGYPSASLRNPADGTYTFSCYEGSEKIAGAIAWYYEKEGLRPMMVGHSQGGFQIVKVLYLLASPPSQKVHVWNPLTWNEEARTEITDPLTGRARPVAGLQLPYATSVAAGGLTRMLPNQWDMTLKLRLIPNSVEEFTGFYKGQDLLGGDFLGYGSSNLFKATGTARVRNVQLPSEWKHREIPDTKRLLKSQATIDRINNYTPGDKSFVTVEPNADTLNPETMHLFWAEDVWYSLKKHWVIELQRLIRARRALHGDS